MAQKGKHPDSHKIIVQTTDGRKLETKSCYGEEGSVIILDLDPHNHPAWKNGKQSFINTGNSQIARFNKRFGNWNPKP